MEAKNPGLSLLIYQNINTDQFENAEGQDGNLNTITMAWSSTLLEFIPLSVDASGNLNVSSSGSGGGGAVTIADGADVTQGALADAAVTTNAAGTVSAKLRGMVTLLGNLISALGSPLQAGGAVSVSNLPATQPVSIAAPVAVTGTFWQATQPISAAALPLPAGAALDSSLATINSTLGTPFQAGASIGNAAFGISGTLPAFAATPTVNLGTIGLAATAALQTTGNTSLANLDVGLSTRLKPADTLAGVTVVGSITAPVAVTGTFFPPTQPISAAALPLPANAAQEAGGNLATTAAATASSAAILAAIDLGIPPAIGAAVTANSMPVNIASDQVVPVSGAFYQDTQPVSAASLPLPSNAAQETGGNLAAIAAQLSQPMAGDSDMAETLAKIASLLGFISYQLGELPLALTNSFNKGVPVPTPDNFATYQLDATGKLN